MQFINSSLNDVNTFTVIHAFKIILPVQFSFLSSLFIIC